MPDEFDVFLSHNSRDKSVVEEIAARLGARGLRAWLDKWELRPGFPWQEGIEEGVRTSHAGAVFVGAAGLGAWQEPEMRAFIARSRREKVPVIPVLLPGCPDSPQLTLFLEAFTWVDLRSGLTEDGLNQLVWGITGKKPEGLGLVAASETGSGKRPGLATDKEKPRAWWTWAVVLSLLAAVLILGARLVPRQPAKPQMYSVRVQVLDPQGQPISGSTIRTSAGNEPHFLQDGWWEVQIPAAKIPADGRITLWAEHSDWQGNSVPLRLDTEPNSQVQIRLKQPETWLRGRVVDGDNRSVSGARVFPEDGTPGVATTDAEGRFELKLSVPLETKVRLRAEHAGLAPGGNFCFAGRDSCPIVLEAR